MRSHRVEHQRRKDFQLAPIATARSRKHRATRQAFERFDGSVVEPDEWTDGDDGDNMQVLPEHIAEEW